MSDGEFAAIDLGATSGRVVLGSVSARRLGAAVVARFSNTPVRTTDGLHWDPFALYDAALDGLRAAARAGGDIRSIGVDAWGVDYALLMSTSAGAGRLLGAPFHYRDGRTDVVVGDVHRKVSQSELFRRNGLEFLPFTTLYQLAAEPRGIIDLAEHLLFMPDLIGYWLTGVPRAERTIASTSGLLSAVGGDWDAPLLESLGFPRRIMPALIEPGEALGALRPSIVQALGNARAAQVTAVGSHDTASAVVAVPMRADAAAFISCGTWGLVGVEVDRPVLTADAHAARFTNEVGVDRRTRLLRNVMGLWVLSESVRTWERAGHRIDLSALLAEAAAVTAAVPLFDVDDARFLPPGDMPARIDAWCVEHGVLPPGSPAEYARSVVESLARAFAEAVREASRIGGVDVRTVHMVGGGVLNTLLCQRTADRLGLPVVAGPVEATALGNILVQARAEGAVRGSLESLRDLVRRTQELRRYEPARQ